MWPKTLDPKRCTQTIHPKDAWAPLHQCPNKRKYKDKCGIHAPEKIAAREGARVTQFERDIARSRGREAAEVLAARDTRILLHMVENLAARAASASGGHPGGYENILAAVLSFATRYVDGQENGVPDAG